MSVTTGDLERPPAEDILSTYKAGGRVIRGGVWRMAANGAGILLGFATATLLLRHLGVAESGRYVTVMSLVAIPVYVVDYGLNVAASRELALRGARDRPLIANILGQKLLIMPASVLLMVGFAIVAGYPERMVIGTALAGMGALIAALANVLLLPLTVELRNVGLALLDFTKQAVTLVGVALLVALGASLTPFFGVLIVAALAGVALIPLAAGRRAFVWPRLDRADQRLLLHTALPMAIALALGQVYFRLVIVLMSLISDPTQTGYFGGSLRATENLVIMPILVSGVALPLLAAAARDDRARLRSAIEGLGEAALIGGVFVVLVAIRAAEPVMTLIGGHQFAPAGAVLRIQVATLIFLALDQIWTASLLALGRQRELILTNALALVGVAAFAAALVPPLGAEGGAVASVLGEFVLAALIYWRLSRDTGKVMVRAMFLARVLVAAGLASLVLLVPGLPDVAAAALMGALFLAIGQLIGMVPKEIHEAFALRQWLARRARASASAAREQRPAVEQHVDGSGEVGDVLTEPD